MLTPLEHYLFDAKSFTNDGHKVQKWPFTMEHSGLQVLSNIVFVSSSLGRLSVSGRGCVYLAISLVLRIKRHQTSLDFINITSKIRTCMQEGPPGTYLIMFKVYVDRRRSSKFCASCMLQKRGIAPVACCLKITGVA